MNTRFVGTKELRQNMAKIAREALQKKSRIIVLRKNRPVFELRPLADDEAFSESFTRSIEKARAEMKAGRVYTQEQIERKLGIT